MSSPDVTFGGKLRGRPPFRAGISSRCPARTKHVRGLPIGGQTSVVAGPLVGSTNGAYPGGLGDGLVFGDRNGAGKSGQEIRRAPITWSVDQPEVWQVGPPTGGRIASIVMTELKRGGRPLQLNATRGSSISVGSESMRSKTALPSGPVNNPAKSSGMPSSRGDPHWLIPQHGSEGWQQDLRSRAVSKPLLVPRCRVSCVLSQRNWLVRDGSRSPTSFSTPVLQGPRDQPIRRSAPVGSPELAVADVAWNCANFDR